MSITASVSGHQTETARREAAMRDIREVIRMKDTDSLRSYVLHPNGPYSKTLAITAASNSHFVGENILHELSLLGRQHPLIRMTQMVHPYMDYSYMAHRVIDSDPVAFFREAGVKFALRGLRLRER